MQGFTRSSVTAAALTPAHPAPATHLSPADLVAAKAAQQKRKAAEKSGKEAKKFKF